MAVHLMDPASGLHRTFCGITAVLDRAQRVKPQFSYRTRGDEPVAVSAGPVNCTGCLNARDDKRTMHGAKSEAVLVIKLDDAHTINAALDFYREHASVSLEERKHANAILAHIDHAFTHRSDGTKIEGAN